MSNIFNKYLWKEKFDISEYTQPDSHFVSLREPNTAEFKQLCKIQSKFTEADKLKDDEFAQADAMFEIVDSFCDICATLITDHDFFDESDETKKASSKEVAEFIRAKINLAKYLLGEYITKVPLVQQSAKK